MDIGGIRRHVTDLSAEWGNRVRSRRESFEWTQADLARALDGEITVQAISKIERGELRPRDYLKIALAIALCCEVEDLFPMPDRASVDRYRRAA